MSLTGIVRPYFERYNRAMMASARDAEVSQRWLLSDLLRTAASTEQGRAYGYDSLGGYEDYAAAVPVVSYEDMRERIMRMVRGERDVLWPGKVRRYAQSSGTSDGKSKYIPLTRRSLSRCHYRGGTDVVARYLSLYPDSRLFDGRGFILGGSYANELNPTPGVKVGDLSASLIDCINPLVNLVRTPSKRVALMADWEEKLDRIVEQTARQNVTNLSGVPSWFLTVLQRVLQYTGKDDITQVWPRLEVFFHGGIAFGPYRKQYESIISSPSMRYMETYNASEGFFALQTDPGDPAMMLLTDVDVFYEFLPLEQLDSPNPRPVPLWEVERGRTYALIITSSNGLWRYLIGDTVRIEALDPVKIVITGRTRSFINAFGEELMVYNADAAIASACAATGADVANYTAAPVFAEGGAKGRHQWLIEFNRPPRSLENFADTLDAALQNENSDYQAKRAGGIFLDRLSIDVAPPGTFDRWLASTGKLGGQRKVPRLSNDRHIIESIIKIIQS